MNNWEKDTQMVKRALGSLEIPWGLSYDETGAELFAGRCYAMMFGDDRYHFLITEFDGKDQVYGYALSPDNHKDDEWGYGSISQWAGRPSDSKADFVAPVPWENSGGLAFATFSDGSVWTTLRTIAEEGHPDTGIYTPYSEDYDRQSDWHAARELHKATMPKRPNLREMANDARDLEVEFVEVIDAA